MNEPVLSPIKQANPRNEPSTKADIATEPKSNQVPSYPVNGWQIHRSDVVAGCNIPLRIQVEQQQAGC